MGWGSRHAEHNTRTAMETERLPDRGSIAERTAPRTSAAETDITLTATPDSNSFFAGWAGSACFGGSGDCKVTIDGNRNMTAVFNSNTGPVSLPRTGQTATYASGDDGAIQAGVAWPNPRFTILYCDASGPCANQASDCDSNSSTDAIIDNLTGLMWARDGDIGNMSANGGTGTTLDGAITYIVDYVNGRVVGNGLCGYKDWRGPNANELISLTNPSASTKAWLAAQGFVKLKNYYWSSTSDASNPTIGDGMSIFWAAAVSALG